MTHKIKTLLKEGLRDLGAMMLSRFVLARGCSGRFLLAACCFGWQVKSNLSGLVGRHVVWSRESVPPLQLWCIPAIIPVVLRIQGAGNHHFKAGFQLQSPAPFCSFWKVKPYPASEETRERHREVTSAAARGSVPGSPGCLPWPRANCSGPAAPCSASSSLLDAPSREGLTRSDHEDAALP